MTIRSLLNAGRADATILENVADGILAFPRAIWLGKSVKVISSDQGELKIDAVPPKRSFCKWYGNLINGGYGGAGAQLFLLPVFLVANVFGTLCLAVGGALKKLSLSRDPLAVRVNEKIEQYQKREPLVQPLLDQLKRQQKEKKWLKLFTKETKDDDQYGITDTPENRERVRAKREQLAQVDSSIVQIKDRINRKVNASPEELVQILEEEKVGVQKEATTIEERIKSLLDNIKQMPAGTHESDVKYIEKEGLERKRYQYKSAVEELDKAIKKVQRENMPE